VGLGVLLVGGAAAIWVLSGSGAGGDDAARAPVSSRAPQEGAPGFVGQAPGVAPAEAHPMQLAPDSVASPEVAAAGTPAAAAAAKDKDKSPVRLTGRVLDETGRPVKGAAVSFIDETGSLFVPRSMIRTPLPPPPSAETGFDGRFALDATVPLERQQDNDLIDLRSRVVVRHDQFATLVHSLDDVKPGTLDVGDLQLEPGAWILGRVVDANGRAISGAEVRARNTDMRQDRRRGGLPGMIFGATLDTVQSGADGRFAVHGLHAGKAELTARRDGLRLATVPAIELETRVPKDIGDVALQPGESIAGVALAEDGAPLAGAEVSVTSMTRLVVGRIEDLSSAQIGQEFGLRASTDSAGHFEIAGLAGGTYTVHLNADGYARLALEDVPAGTGNLRLQPVRLGGLLLTVLDSRSGAPVPGARIKATPAPAEGQRTWMVAGDTLTVLAGAEALAAAGAAAGGPPVPDAAYFVKDAGLDGTDLVIAAEHYATQEVKAGAVASREVLPVTVRLVPESLVAGNVVDERGAPIEGATVKLERPEPEDEGNSVSFGRGRFERHIERNIRLGNRDENEEVSAETMTARTGADGRFELRGAAAGDWTLKAAAADRVSSEPVALKLEEAASRDGLQIVLPMAGSIAGVVTEADGTPASDIEIVVEARSKDAPAPAASGDDAASVLQFARLLGNRDGSKAGPRVTRTSTDGRYEVTNLAEGEYGVRIGGGPRRGRSLGAAVFVTLDDALNPKDDANTIWAQVKPGEPTHVDLVRPRRGVVRGDVTAGGHPVPGVQVTLKPDSGMPFDIGRGERAETDAHGAFRFEDVEAGKYTLSAKAPGAGLPEKASVALEAGQEGRANLAFSGVDVSGRVIDTAGGKGAPGVLIHLEPAKEETAGLESAFQVEFVMAGAGGGPRGGMSMTVGGGNSESARTDDEGRFTMHYVKPGRYTISVSGGGYMKSTTDTFDVSEGHDKDDVHVEVTRGGIVAGTVTSGATGDRLDKVPVRLEGEGGSQMTVTDDGEYKFDGLEPGDYTVEVLGSGFMSEPIASVKVSIGKAGDVRAADLVTKG